MAAADDIKRVVGLFRVSTEEQEQEGNSLDAQRRMYDMDCRAFGWKSLDIYSGHETGTSLDARRIIHELIDTLADLKPDAIWVREQSRLTRGDQLDVALLLRTLRESGTLVVTERGHVLDLNDIEGEFLFSIKAIIDRREYQVIRRRSTLGKNEKARRGLLASGRPAYGYRVEGSGRDKGLRVPEPDEAPAVRLIFELAAKGQAVNQIIRELADRGISAPTSKGRVSGKQPTRFKGGLQLWGATTIKRMLRNPIYVGVSYRNCWVKKGRTQVFDPQNPDAIWISDAHEAIVPKAIWDEAHRQLDTRAIHRNTLRHMLTGILRCPTCGSAMRVDSSGDGRGGHKRYYVCGSKRRPEDEFGRRARCGDACPSRYQPVEATDDRMWGALVRLISNPDMVQEYLERGGAAARVTRLGREIASLKKQREVRQKKIELAREKLLNEVFTDGDFLTVKEKLEGEIRGLTKQIDHKAADLESNSGDAYRQLLHSLAMLKLGDRKLTAGQRGDLVRALVRRISPEDESLEMCEVELNAGFTPRLVESERARTENRSSAHYAARRPPPATCA